MINEYLTNRIKTEKNEIVLFILRDIMFASLQLFNSNFDYSFNL